MKLEILRCAWATLWSWRRPGRRDPFTHRPGTDDQWGTWTGADGRPIPLNNQAAADRFEEGRHGR